MQISLSYFAKEFRISERHILAYIFFPVELLNIGGGLF
jgi:hypothetical protein